MVDVRFFETRAPITLELLLSDEPDVAVEPRLLDVVIGGASELEVAMAGDIVLAANRKYIDGLRQTEASVAIIGNALKDDVPEGTLGIITRDPHGLFTRVLSRLYPDSSRRLSQRNAVPGNTDFEEGVVVAPGAHIAQEVQIGARTLISPQASIGFGVTIGRDCVIGPNVSIECAHIGDNVVVGAGTQIGGEGFGWLDHGKSNTKIPQLGRVIIQDGVEIGTNSTIDRGALGDTSIGEGTKIDNLVQIGHNCQIGRYCLIAAMTGLSGSTIVEDSVLMGGGVGTSGHLRIGAGSVIHGRAAVTKDWPAGSKLAGAPAQDIKDFWRELANLRNLGTDKKD